MQESGLRNSYNNRYVKIKFIIFEQLTKYYLMERNKKILEDLKFILQKKFGENIIDVILFGSRVKGNAKKDSDFDILLILKDKADWKLERKISDECYYIDLKYNILTDVHLLSKSEFNTLRGKQPIFVNALKQGIYA